MNLIKIIKILVVIIIFISISIIIKSSSSGSSSSSMIIFVIIIIIVVVVVVVVVDKIKETSKFEELARRVWTCYTEELVAFAKTAILFRTVKHLFNSPLIVDSTPFCQTPNLKDIVNL